ncbi:hypothetical protein BLA60_27305 [Actinophytocola xinjiangensis]|uniref:Uncharacterized protein n=2 Tax=Actinophytocola xinjiangensis TaxID=485602 RepID=A0A7Z1AX11_9PSEU|nr:hypothetical protein BLA60_27305 [Actinophytocola xinjiangensis]
MWTGGVLAFGVLVVMALGPVIVEIDAWLFERRHRRTPSTQPDQTPAEDRPHHEAAITSPRTPHRVTHNTLTTPA